MSFFSAEEIGDILGTAQIGLWRLEVEQGVVKRIYTDSFMDELMGVSRDATPEEKVVFLTEHIAPEDNEMFGEYTNKLLEMEQAEVVYKYLHPQNGAMYIRCGGKRSEYIDGKLIIQGCHQNITESIRV